MTASGFFWLLTAGLNVAALAALAYRRPRGMASFTVLIAYKFLVRDVLLGAYRHDPFTLFLLYWASSFGMALLVCAALSELGYFDPDAMYYIYLLSVIVGTVSIFFDHDKHFPLRLVHSFERGFWIAPLLMIGWGLVDKPALLTRRDRRIYAGFSMWIIGRFLFAFAKSSGLTVALWANSLDAPVTALWILAILAIEPKMSTSQLWNHLTEIASHCDFYKQYIVFSGLPEGQSRDYALANGKRKDA